MSTKRQIKRLLFQAPSLDGCRETCKKDYSFETKIGEGAFGQVWKIKHKKTGKYYACKQVSKEKVVKMIDQFRREVFIMYEVTHSHIIKLYHHFEDEKYFYLVMELAEAGSLFQKLVSERCFLERQANQYFREVMDAIDCLHSHNPAIIHRDIKPENILIDKEGNLKVTDFGWSNYYSSEQGTPRYTICGTTEYLCPEMVKETGHTPAVDIWCLGVLLYEMLCGFTPFRSAVKESLMQNISKAKIKFPNNISQLAKNLITRMLEKNPQKRITLDKIKEHGWVNLFCENNDGEGRSSIKELGNIGYLSVPSDRLEPPKPKEFMDNESNLNSFRKSISKIKQELYSRIELCKKNRENIKVITTQIKEEEASGKIIEQEITEKRRKLADLEGNIKTVNEKLLDSNIQLEKLSNSSNLSLFREKIEKQLNEFCAKLLEVDNTTLKKNELDSEISLLTEQHIDKEKYLENLRQYSKKINKKGSMLHSSKQSQLKNFQNSYEFLTSQIEQHESLLAKIESPENKMAREIMYFIRAKKQEIIEVSTIEDKLRDIEDKLSLKEVDIELIKIDFLDRKSKFIRNIRIEKENIARRNSLQALMKIKVEQPMRINDMLVRQLENSRIIEKKYMLESIELSRARAKATVIDK